MMKVLIIDNYDSFVFNLERYLVQLGASTCVFRNDKITLDEIAALEPTHVVLSPGPCSPGEAGICLDIVKKLIGVVPILGVCLGHQAIGQALGGVVERARFPMHGKSSSISHNQTGLFSGLPDGFQAGRYHSLIVSKDNFPGQLSIDAWSTEGEIMALSWEEKSLYGVQFHPEATLTENGYDMLKNFLRSKIA